MTIVSIRGTHGSGKSSVVTKIMGLYPFKTIETRVPGKPNKPDKLRTDGYVVALPNGETLYIVGPYKTACGGCDAIQPYSDIAGQIGYGFGACDHVLLEGALVSSSYGTIGHLMDTFAPNAVFAFLDTPLDECLRRIAARRAAKGNFEPVNPKNTSVKHENVARTKAQMDKLGSRIRIVDIDHTQAVRQVLKLFGVNLRKEPT